METNPQHQSISLSCVSTTLVPIQEFLLPTKASDGQEASASTNDPSSGECKGHCKSQAEGTCKHYLPRLQSPEEVLKSLEGIRRSTKLWKVYMKGPHLGKHAVVILATRSFSKWLERDEFIRMLLEAETRGRGAKMEEGKTNFTKYNGMEIDVLHACIDGLSPQGNWISNMKEGRAKEGFSILLGPRDVLPNLWDIEERTIANNPGKASLTFTDRQNSRGQVILPLANTLFSNGRHSTLLASEWRVQDGSFIKIRSSEKKNQIITAFHNLGAPSSRVPAIPLTPARRIVSGLGNIVRQIDFGEDGAGPASRELEANINEYFLLSGRPKSTIAVWALIIPEAAVPTSESESADKLLVDMNVVKSQWKMADPSPDLVGYWTNRHATFCRVLSGGGGWGVKQGLLSLDPETSYGDISEAQFDFSAGSLEEQQASALGSIAKPDSYIQFFIADNQNETSEATEPVSRSGEGPNTPDISRKSRMSTVLGTAPSTIDDQPSEPTGSQNARNALRRNIFPQVGHFGAVSESGIFLRKNAVDSKGQEIHNAVVATTKIDLPFSYIYRSVAPTVWIRRYFVSEHKDPSVDDLKQPLQTAQEQKPLVPR
jgi:hypothetical protein